jgi:ribosomal protein S20
MQKKKIWKIFLKNNIFYYFDILNNSINAFKKYVYTNEELNDYYKTRYKNFIKSVLKLIQLNSDKILTQKYIEELNANKDVLEHKWLIDSATELLPTK